MTQQDPFSDENDVGRDVDGENEGNLLEMEEKEAASKMFKEWEDSRQYVKNYIEQWKLNQAHSQGYTGVKLVKKQDEQQFFAPLGATPSATSSNKALRLKRRVRARIFADPPIPHVEPTTDEDMNRERADFSTTALSVVGGEGELNIPLKAGQAFELAGDYGSGFMRFWVDEQGGGHRTTINEDGTEEEEWLPKLRVELLTGKNVRFIPYTAEDVWDADGLMVGSMIALGELKGMFPDNEWSDEDISEMTDRRPTHLKDLLPVGQKERLGTDNEDETLVFVLTRYHRVSAEYPKGAYILAAGKKTLVREEWYDDQHDMEMDIPVSQIAHYYTEDNPYYEGTMTGMGPGNEIRNSVLGTMLEYLDKFRTRKTFVPITSNIQARQLQAPTKTVIPIAPGGQPFYEEIPDFPRIVEKMFEFQTADLDDESGLQETAQGLAPGSVTSGKQVEQIVSQVAVGLSELKHNTERGLIRCWRIMLQLMRAYYDKEQLMAWVGEDGSHKVKLWTGADLSNSSDVRIARGSFTMMAPEMKAQTAASLAQAGLIDQQQAISIVVGNVGPTIGIKDEPHRQRVRRQITVWEEGPPEIPLQLEPPQVDPQTGQPPNPFAQALQAIFSPLPVDEEPTIAALRSFELGKALASVRFQTFQPGWQQGIVQEYMRMRQAAGIVTRAEQAQQAQQAQQQQQQGAQTVAQTKVQEAQIKGQAETQKAQIAADGGVKKAMIDLEKTQVPGVSGERVMP